MEFNLYKQIDNVNIPVYYKTINTKIEVKTMGVTIKDVAREAGVSHITVSRALNNNPNVTAKTKEKVLEVAKRMNYTPNMNAKSLVLNRSFTIGLFFTSISKGTSPEIFYELVEKCNADISKDYNIVVKGIDHLSSMNQIAHANYDGIILFSQSSKDQQFVSEVIERHIPLVVLNKETLNAHNIMFNDELGAYSVLNELLTNNHRDIAFLMGVEHASATISRIKGYEKALHEHQLKIEDCICLYGDYTYDEGYNMAKKAMKSSQSISAMCCQNDDMAIGAMKAIREEGLHVPEDISICGYDGTKAAQLFDPALTTVKRPINKGLDICISQLMGLIKDRKKKQTDQGLLKVILKPELVLGESVKKI